MIAPERAKRPEDFIAPAQNEHNPHAECIFCIGSPAHHSRYPEYDTQFLYVMPNKFPAFVSEGYHEVRSYYPEMGFYRAKPAVGGHDVIVINDENLRLFDFPVPVMTDLLTTMQKRYRHYRNDPHVEYVIGIYNYGKTGGASIDHPHAQLLASSIVPNEVTLETHGSEHYYEINGRCVFCEIIDHEKQENVRLLAENDDFIMFTFFAARFPFETWILPKNHQSMYENTSKQSIINLATILLQGLTMLDKNLKNPSLNFYIHSLPTTSQETNYYHWHLEITPRVATYGGFEMGSGTIIDVTSPEKAAEFLLASNTANH